MAEVKMSLEQLDALREDITKAQDITKERDEQIKKLEKELYEVQADRRVIRITKQVGSAYGPTAYSIDFNGIINDVQNYTRNDRYGASPYDYEFLQQQIKHRVKTSYLTPEPTETKEFIGFDDVKAELRAELETKIAEELAELRRIKANADEKIAAITVDFEYRFTKVNKDNKQSLDAVIEAKKELEKNKDKAYEDLYQEYQDLKADKKRISREKELEEKVAELEAKLAKKGLLSWFK